VGANSTKAIITPGMAFPVKFKGRNREIDVQVNKLVLFHPSPIRVDNIQHDAVLMLNDPLDQGTNVVIMIPLRGSISAGQSGAFVGKVAPFISGILEADATTKAYPSIDIPTGNDWDLTKVLPVTPNPSTSTVDVSSGYFVWGGIPAMEEYLVPGSNPWTTMRYDWRPVGVAPTYIMLKNPVEINSFDLQTIRMLPVTPSAGAIHAPAMTTLTYKPGPAGSDVVGCATSSGTTRETFANGCDPLESIGQPSGTFRLDSGQVITMLSTLVGIIAGVIAVYFAMKLSVDPKYGKVIGVLSAKLGRAMSGAVPALPALPALSALPALPVAPPPPPPVDETAFEGVNPMRSSRRTTPSRAPVDTRVRNSLQGFRAPRSRAPSLTRDQTVAAAIEEPVSAPVLSPEQIDVALDEEPNPAAGTGILPGSILPDGVVVGPRRRRVQTKEEEDAEYAARVQKEDEAVKAAEHAKKAAEEAAKKAQEEAEEAVKKAQEEAEEARLKAQDEAVKAQIRAQAPNVAALQADVDRRAAAFKRNKEVLDATLARARELAATKKAIESTPTSAPPGTWNRLLKGINSPAADKAIEESKKARTLAQQLGFAKSHLSARAKTATAKVPASKSVEAPVPREKTTNEKIFDARRVAAKRREGIAPRMPGGKNTRKNKRHHR
jgi:flagellar biosynthesis/type III secretory pathway protein FliH